MSVGDPCGPPVVADALTLRAELGGAFLLWMLPFLPMYYMLSLCADSLFTITWSLWTIFAEVCGQSDRRDDGVCVHDLLNSLIPRTPIWFSCYMMLVLSFRFFTAAGLVDWAYLSRLNCTNCLAFHNYLRAVALFC
jgi:hypothetical protein